MASISKQPNSRRMIQFTTPDGQRKTIRLGKVSQRDAEATKFRVEQLLAAKVTGRAIEADTARWVAELPNALADKLAIAGLVSPREELAAVPLGHFMRNYLDGQKNLKPATKVVRGQVIRDLVDYFGESRDARELLPGDADDFKQSLIGRGLAPTTIHKRLQVAGSFFRAMCRRRLIAANPFDGVTHAATGIKDRQRFIPREVVARVLDACPDHHWRAIVALARYGGLRCPSEVLSLRWQDIDWDAGRVVVTSPKTEHHAEKDSRVIPLFPELRPILAESFELAPDGAEFVVDPKYRRAAMGPTGWLNANLRTTFLKIVRRAGVDRWPRPFHNLRASRETELAADFPIHVVTAWLGNTPRIAIKHYLQVTDTDFDRAASPDPKALQKALQQMHATGGKEGQAEKAAHEKTPVLPGFAGTCESTQLPGMAGTGFEPATSRL